MRSVAGCVAFDPDSAEAGEPEDVEDVFGAGGSADDVLADGLGGVGLLEFGDGAEGVEDFGGLRSESGGEVSCAGVGGCGGDLSDGGGVDAGVLADVEGLEVEAVGADLEEERVDEQLGEAVAAVLEEAVAEDGEVGEEVGGAGVGASAGWVASGTLDCGRGSEAHHDAGDEQAEDSWGKRSSRAVWPAARSWSR